MFEIPPTWTAPIANLTQWFDWEALGAIGTVGALTVALNQVFRASRFERLRAASTLTRLGELLGPIDQLSTHDENRILLSDTFPAMLEDGLIDRAIRGIEVISVDHVPDTTVTNYVQTLPLILAGYKRSLEAPGAELFPPSYDEHASYINEANAYFSLLRELYLRGSWKARRLLAKQFWVHPR